MSEALIVDADDVREQRFAHPWRLVQLGAQSWVVRNFSNQSLDHPQAFWSRVEAIDWARQRAEILSTPHTIDVVDADGMVFLIPK